MPPKKSKDRELIDSISSRKVFPTAGARAYDFARTGERLPGESMAFEIVPTESDPASLPEWAKGDWSEASRRTAQLSQYWPEGASTAPTEASRRMARDFQYTPPEMSWRTALEGLPEGSRVQRMPTEIVEAGEARYGTTPYGHEPWERKRQFGSAALQQALSARPLEERLAGRMQARRQHRAEVARAKAAGEFGADPAPRVRPLGRKVTVDLSKEGTGLTDDEVELLDYLLAKTGIQK